MNAAVSQKVPNEDAFKYTARLAAASDINKVLEFFNANKDDHIHPRKEEALKTALKNGRVILLETPDHDIIGMSVRYAYALENGFEFQEYGSVMIAPEARGQDLFRQMTALQLAAAFTCDPQKPAVIYAEIKNIDGRDGTFGKFVDLGWDAASIGTHRAKLFETQETPYDGPSYWCLHTEAKFKKDIKSLMKPLRDRNNIVIDPSLESAFSAMGRLSQRRIVTRDLSITHAQAVARANFLGDRGNLSHTLMQLTHNDPGMHLQAA